MTRLVFLVQKDSSARPRMSEKIRTNNQLARPATYVLTGLSKTKLKFVQNITNVMLVLAQHVRMAYFRMKKENLFAFLAQRAKFAKQGPLQSLVTQGKSVQARPSQEALLTVRSGHTETVPLLSTAMRVTVFFVILESTAQFPVF